MKILITLSFTLFTALCHGQNDTKEYVYDRLSGDFNLEIYSPSTSENGKWSKSGFGQASFVSFFDGTYIREQVKTNIQGNSYHMDNTIGIDGRSGNFRLIAVDKEFSTMDVFNGRFENNRLVFDNLLSDLKMYNPKGEEINFKLTYSFHENGKNVLLVEYSKDSGNNWLPFSKQIQIPVNK